MFLELPDPGITCLLLIWMKKLMLTSARRPRLTEVLPKLETRTPLNELLLSVSGMRESCRNREGQAVKEVMDWFGG